MGTVEEGVEYVTNNFIVETGGVIAFVIRDVL